MRKGKRMGEKGFSLVELIVTIAVFTIAIGAIGTFLVSTQRNYSDGVTESDLQYKAQLVSNQLQDLMIAAAKGLTYYYEADLADGSGSESGNIFTDSEITEGDEVTTKQIFIYNEKDYYRINWKDDKLYLSKLSYAVGGGVVVDANGDFENQLMAENVSLFSVDLTNLSTNGVVDYTIVLKMPNSAKEYKLTKTVNVRNRVAVNPTYEAVSNPDVTIEVEPNSIIVAPAELRLWAYKSDDSKPDTDEVNQTGADLSAIVKSNSGYMPNQKVYWKAQETVYNDENGICKLINGNHISIVPDSYYTNPTQKFFHIFATKEDSEGNIIESNTIAVKFRNLAGILTTPIMLEGDGAQGEETVLKNVGSENYEVSIPAKSLIEVRLSGFESPVANNIDDLMPDPSKGISIADAISSVGGISIVTEGSDGIVDSITSDITQGIVRFKVKDEQNIVRDENGDATFKISFMCNRYGSRNGSNGATINQEITVRIEKPIIIEKPQIDAGWDCGGIIDVNLRSLGITTNSKVQIKLEYLNPKNEVISVSDTYGNNSGNRYTKSEFKEIDSEKEYLFYKMDQNTNYVDLYVSGVQNAEPNTDWSGRRLKLQLKDAHNYSRTYGRYEQNGDIDKVVISISNDGKEVYSTTVVVNPVAIGYFGYAKSDLVAAYNAIKHKQADNEMAAKFVKELEVNLAPAAGYSISDDEKQKSVLNANNWARRNTTIKFSDADYNYGKFFQNGNLWQEKKDYFLIWLTDLYYELEINDDIYRYVEQGNKAKCPVEAGYFAEFAQQGGSQTYKAYFAMTEGWNAANIDYVLNNARFACVLEYRDESNDVTRRYSYVEESVINGPNNLGGTRYHRICKSDYADEDGFVAITTGTDDYGCYVEVKVPNSFIKFFEGGELKVIYEGPTSLNSTEALKIDSEVEGCSGVISFQFQPVNIIIVDNQFSNSMKKPSILYCPKSDVWEEKMVGLEQMYYYINSEERFDVRKVNGNIYISYQVYESSSASKTGTWKYWRIRTKKGRSWVDDDVPAWFIYSEDSWTSAGSDINKTISKQIGHFELLQSK